MNSRLTASVLAAVMLSLLPQGAFAHEERGDLGYFTLVAEDKTEVFKTGIAIKVGDRFICPENREYEVIEVVGDEARLVSRGEAAMEPKVTGMWDSFLGLVRSIQVQGEGKPTVGIYHTHSDESYQPTDGSPSIRGKGGVLKVGARFSQALEDEGLATEHDRTPHDPHDAGAYERSRRTAMRLNNLRPAAIFDVHRDTPPREVYLGRVGGKEVAQILIVLGRQNPQLQSNMAFAKRVKARADEETPGLMRGILVAAGKFNQDLHPRSLLLEVGSFENTREEAERGITALAGIVPSLLGADAPGAGAQGRSGIGVIGGILLAVVLGGASYLLISTGSLKEALAKMKRMVTEEFTSFLGKRPRDGGPGDTQGGGQDNDS
ncbi:MAG: stage II sporulation protein P [Bacillota bacterium]